MSHSTVFQERLSAYRDITQKKMLALLPSREPRKHLYDLLPDYPTRPGKGLRAALCLATCNAFGGTPDKALNSAVAIELLHNGFLLHDDVQDESLFRRGKSTFHQMHGVGMTINVGNALNLFGLQILTNNHDRLGSQLSRQLFGETEEMLRHTLEGQAMELGWIKDNNCELSEQDYLRMSLKKTSWYTGIYPCRAGALIATEGTVNPDRFYRFGWFLGVAFQIQDDLLNLVGSYQKYGKEIYGDILEGKRTLMLIHLLNHCSGKQKARLRAYLALPRPTRDAASVKWVYDLMVEYGSINFARSCARQFAGAALYEFTRAFGDLPDGPDKEFILELIVYMIEREY